MKLKRDRPTIGVLAGWQVYAGALDTFLGPVYHGIRAAAQNLGCNLLLSCSIDLGTARGSPRLAWPILAPDTDFAPVGPWNTDGLIVVGQSRSNTQAVYLQHIAATGHPLVFVGAGESGPSVIADNEGGIRQAFVHLIEHGHRRIAFIAGMKDKRGDSARRLRAYQELMQEYQLGVDERLIAYGFHSFDGGQQAMKHILESGAPFTAVLASNDRSALGAIRALTDAGIAVPQEVAVIGFDDRIEATAHIPPLTTVRYPAFEEGYQGVALLLEYIEGKRHETCTIRIPTRLVIRESCGCLPGVLMAGPPNVETLPDIRDAERLAPQIAQLMADKMMPQIQRLGADEVYRLCLHLVEAFVATIETGKPLTFHMALRQTLRHIMSREEDLCTWQAAISSLRASLPFICRRLSPLLTPKQVEELLDQARLAIGEALHEQYTRHLIRQARVAEYVGRMTARFFAAQDEAALFDVLSQSLPETGIRHVTVAFYEPESEDPVAWSVLQVPQRMKGTRLHTRQFPPPGLYPEDEPFSLAVLPLLIQDRVHGFVAFDTGNLEPCAEIVRQLGVALRSIWLYREAVEGKRLAEEASRLKSRFLSVVSHELRTPLNLICGLSDMLLRESEQIGAQECRVNRKDLERIYVGAQHLDGLIRDVLDLAQSDMGQLKLVCEPLDLTEVLQPISMIGEQLARDKELTWRAEIPETLPIVWGDRTRLRQVILNLVNNAVKFTAHGEVALEAVVEDGKIVVSVRDTGLGIPADEQEAIFDEFRQSERTTARGYGGLGLGLAICKRLVEMHGGEIGVHSSGEEGAGSTFYFTLPIMEASLPEAPVLPLFGQKVLLLTKESRGDNVLRDHLTRRGFEVLEYQVQETIELPSAILSTPPDIVVVDLKLATERGWEILRMLKTNHATRGIPVFYCELAGDKAGGPLADIDYLTKPIGTKELAEALTSQGLLTEEETGITQKKILVVDDDPAVLEMHARIVETQLPGCLVLQARDGREALALLRREKPDLVLLDLFMPELDGFGVLEAMQADASSRNIPVIVLTGQTLTAEELSRLNRGVASFIEKGLLSVEEMMEHVVAALAHRRRPGSESYRTVLKALAFIHAHYAEPISRSDIAAHVGLSERHLTRCFRQETGITPITYLNRYRVKQAKSLLEAGDKGITEIAMEVGFSTGGYFTRVFRQEVGISPTAYLQSRKRLSQKYQSSSQK
jgi:signal transduction histidine kinase/DNA-binding LacI/PurR family transcriptional regulator/AraC-like DNA-binding protein/DNA-binding LytR/AlgR family response regulator